MQPKKQMPRWLLPVIITAIVLNILILLGNYYKQKQLQEQKEFYQLTDTLNEELDIHYETPQLEN